MENSRNANAPAPPSSTWIRNSVGRAQQSRGFHFQGGHWGWRKSPLPSAPQGQARVLLILTCSVSSIVLGTWVVLQAGSPPGWSAFRDAWQCLETSLVVTNTLEGCNSHQVGWGQRCGWTSCNAPGSHHTKALTVLSLSIPVLTTCMKCGEVWGFPLPIHHHLSSLPHS